MQMWYYISCFCYIYTIFFYFLLHLFIRGMNGAHKIGSHFQFAYL